MIEIININKSFHDMKALIDITAQIPKGSIFGLIGTNGAGKSTLLRIIAGIYRPDSGSVTIDGEPVFENTNIKQKFFYISDDQYFFSNITPKELANYYKQIYEKFDMVQFEKLIHNFELPLNKKIQHFSKGMKKQVSIIAAIAAHTDYIFCDETFDGLDPVIRQGVKSLFAAEVTERQLTPIIASHNLRELEDICDRVGLLHKGGMLLSCDLDSMKLGIHKIQCIFKEPLEKSDFPDMEIMSLERRGSLHTITVRGETEVISAKISALNPLFMEMLPLTLEEIFISETEVTGYDVKKLLL